ncbi:helix-turn-helix domain-containing protein [Vibrio sp. M260118]|uniref:helix-turn-helix domain-containing protein n=1 Tax=Vibrio sp. M260118 TaxID=3020896 RepID=UPI002F402DBB
MEEQKLITFGEHIRHLRHKKSISQEELAARCGLDRTYVSGIERGKRNISLLNLFKLAHGLEIEAKELLDFTDGDCHE